MSPVPTSLAPEDVARLRMAVPENPMVITAVLVLERALPRAALSRLIEMRLLCHPRFRRTVVEPRWGSPRWVDMAGFDLREQCVWHNTRAGSLTVGDFAQERMNEPLDCDRPLWRLDVLEGTEHGAALVFRVHHVIADGAALVGVLGGLTDEGSGADGILSQPVSRREHASLRLFRLVKGTAAAARLALRAPDPTMSHHGTLGTIKRVAYSSALSLPHIAARARAAGVTITEMLLAAVVSALRELLVSRGRVPDITLHALVPAGLHRTARGEIGNDYASISVELPLGAPPEERVRRIANNLRAARTRGALRSSAHLVGAASAVSRPIERFAVSFFSRRASCVASSVRGPSSPVHLGGVLVRDVLVWAPAPGTVPLSVTLMSYAGRVRIGVCADARVIGDAGPIVDVLERELGAGRLSCVAS